MSTKYSVTNAIIYRYCYPVNPFKRVAAWFFVCFFFTLELFQERISSDIIHICAWSALYCYHTYSHVDLFQSCCDYLSRQGTNAETVWNNLVSRVHPVNLFSPQIYECYCTCVLVKCQCQLLVVSVGCVLCHWIVSSGCHEHIVFSFQPTLKFSDAEDLTTTETCQNSCEESAENNSGRAALLK